MTEQLTTKQLEERMAATLNKECDSRIEVTIRSATEFTISGPKPMVEGVAEYLGRNKLMSLDEPITVSDDDFDEKTRQPIAYAYMTAVVKGK